MFFRILLPAFFLVIAVFSCNTKETVDLILYNGVIYTANDKNETKQACAIKDGKFVAIGSNDFINSNYIGKEKIDVLNKFVYPGFIDAHCHFYHYGLSLDQVDLRGTSSFQEVVKRITEHYKKHPQLAWIIGRGWDQNDWENKSFPSKDTLDLLFKDIPVFLERIDGHAALVNQKALTLANINENTEVAGGLINKNDKNLTGVLIDNAVELVSKVIPVPGKTEQAAGLKNAQANCFAVGLTTVSDAGLDKEIIELIDSLQKADQLKMRIYAMISATPANKEYYLKKGIYKTPYLNVRSFKVYADGALGSRGACLLKPYSDDAKNHGLLLQSISELESMAAESYKSNFQMNTHCIGDSANHLLLDIYSKVLPLNNDRRWRIEHAQVVARADVPRFKDFKIIASVQPTHCTSDMYWAESRLGKERIKTAYAYKSLYEQNNLIAFGSDFPVEHINPIYGFHAAVARQDGNNYPPNGFQMENSLSREDALKGMTLWPAYANFEEKEKGSIEVGKYADFVILNEDIMKINVKKIRKATVNQTFVNGIKVYESIK